MAASTVSKDSEGIYTELASTQQDVYSTLGHTTLNSSRAQHTKKSGQSSHPYRLAAVCLGLLCALLLAATIVLCVLYTNQSGKYSMLERGQEELRANSSTLKRVYKPCPQGWEQFSSKCYYFSMERKSWKDSHSDCIKWAADLVIIESQEEQEFITKYIQDYYWIGLSDLETEGTWLWVDGTLLQKNYWKSGEPDDRNQLNSYIYRPADCAVTYPDHSDT
ncbi:CD209 antigen-like protein E isoform X2 [Conger conger]|uniref:CD209 antigen-like protein E isoform X2 n=1 Tax=Conger conger TaxID=82655 RepID=UPI002A5A6174|nr:CD209 antigen-like protein E isoform X2 [Conger conger]